MTRTHVTFPSGDATCAAWLYSPTTTTTDLLPIIVMGHGVAGVREQRLDAFAERFAAAGYACLVFDYRHFGASGGQPRQLLDVRHQLQDWRSAVAYARTLDGIDPDRVIAWGSSFGGGHAIITAARDRQIAAAIAQCPFTDGVASARVIKPSISARLTVLALKDRIGSLLGRAPILVPAYGEPGTLALMTTPDALPGISALNSPGRQAPIDIAARFVLQIVKHFPGRQARNVTCPILFVICENDSVAPAGPTRKYAAQAPRGEVILTNAGHFDIYVGDDFEKNVPQQIDFLQRHIRIA